MTQFLFHHVGLAVRDINKAIDSYQKLFGYEVTAGPFDDPIQKVSVCFMSQGGGDTVLELVAPLGSDSPVMRILKVGGSVYHICYQVADIEVCIQSLIEKGSFLISGPDPAVAFNQRPIAWLMTETNLLVELLQE
jgi:methylmalonyl-CoA/ethylmalonyl-CoA epimerase